MSQDGRLPVQTFRAGKMRIALWENESAHEDSTCIPYVLKLSKRHSLQQLDDWTTTEYLYPSDLPTLIICAQKALEFISLREVDDDEEEE